jgi:hypothetical protein
MSSARRHGLQLAFAAAFGLVLVACGDNAPAQRPPPGPPPPAKVPLRRLTNAEYAATVADLFPGATLPEMVFVPDAKVLGFLNISSSQTGSLVRMEQYEMAALGIAQAVTADATALTGCDAAVQGEATCARPYVTDLGKRAYRRPLTAAELDGLMALLARNADTIDYKTRLSIVIQAMLLSPKFLFRPEIGDRALAGERGVPLTSWEVASRLSFFLTGSIPDAELAGAADAGTLTSPEAIGIQARRLLALPRAQAQLVRMHNQWLGTDTVSALAKEEKAFPDFTPLTAFGYAKETDTFIRNVLFEQGGSFSDLMLANYTFANKSLAEFYGTAAPATDWDRVELDPQRRSGLLTQAGLLATMAKQDRTDPVRRGKFVLERILCRNVTPPSPEIVAMFKPLDLSKTAREQFAQHAADPKCATCHQVLDPLGLPFEHYDSTGKWINDDRGMAIDATGSIDGRAFDGVPGLARLLVDMPEARACYVEQWLRFSSGKLLSDADKANVDWLMTSFSATTSVVDLVVAMVQGDSFRYLQTDPTLVPGGTTP